MVQNTLQDFLPASEALGEILYIRHPQEKGNYDYLKWYPALEVLKMTFMGLNSPQIAADQCFVPNF